MWNLVTVGEVERGTSMEIMGMQPGCPKTPHDHDGLSFGDETSPSSRIEVCPKAGTRLGILGEESNGRDPVIPTQTRSEGLHLAKGKEHSRGCRSKPYSVHWMKQGLEAIKILGTTLGMATAFNLQEFQRRVLPTA